MLAFLRSSRLPAVALGMICAGLACAPNAFAGTRRPVAAVVIYPGDVIRENMIMDAEIPDTARSSVYVNSHDALIGKVAKRTFLPGSPFPSMAIGVPRLVSVGAMVRLVYSEGGLEIVTYASALQNGTAGDVVTVRNLESGVTIMGVVRQDGSVLVGPG